MSEGNTSSSNGSPANEVVLIVDDEEMVLNSLNSFLMLETDYEVRTFTNPEEALEHVAQHPVDMVISDYLMPQMDGITFLGKVKAVQPDVPRIILTGYSDKENAIKAINEVGLFQYVEKPWDNDRLHLIIRNGLEKQQLIKELRTKIDAIDKAHSDLQGIQTEILKAFS
jgi:DNA-binding NtrC family response regulator